MSAARGMGGAWFARSPLLRTAGLSSSGAPAKERFGSYRAGWSNGFHERGARRVNSDGTRRHIPHAGALRFAARVVAASETSRALTVARRGVDSFTSGVGSSTGPCDDL